ncbi:hypothetical protein CTI12_AA012140 [Artemisia annua]|uniref:Membrane-associated kinase regulator 6 n=1 Tax=Artemisia annua TaxID=35608 RepID=A0A2U1QL05_ARTAN|nr:hypothetical protein CTI12_AA012140 [Artemisia annua]
METSQPLTIESFSYSWLINQNPPIQDIFNDNDTNSVSSPRFTEESENFCFDLPYIPNVAHADEMFSNGRIIPKSVNQIRLYSCPATPIVLFPPKNSSKFPKKYSEIIASWRVSSKKLLGKCFSFLVPRKTTRIADSSRNSVCLSSKISNEQMSTRLAVYKTTFRRTKSWSPNSTTVPRFSCSKNKTPDYNEGSVHEAIAHCKRSFGNAF